MVHGGDDVEGIVTHDEEDEVGHLPQDLGEDLLDSHFRRVREYALLEKVQPLDECPVTRQYPVPQQFQQDFDVGVRNKDNL